MIIRTRISLPLAIALMALLLLPLGGPSAAAAAVYKIPWWTVDCGSDMTLTGGSYGLSGTIAQPDAGPATAMSGGTYTLVGGFWQPAAVAPCEPCDTNCDGTVNPFDIQPFVLLLGSTPPPPCAPCAGDANFDGTVNPFDINAFLVCMSGG